MTESTSPASSSSPQGPSWHPVTDFSVATVPSPAPWPTLWTDADSRTQPSSQNEAYQSFRKKLRTGTYPFPSMFPVSLRPIPPLDAPSQPNPYDPFFVPREILIHPLVLPQTSCKLLQLPLEILGLIFREVQVPYFQVALALTCKTMARVASDKTIMSPWRGYRDKDGLFRLLERKNNLIPDTMRLCRACFRFRPRDVAYWENELKCPEFDDRKANWFDIFSWFGTTYQQHRCPWCAILGYTNYFREAHYVEDRDTQPVHRRVPMCPDLTRRINRP